MAEVKHPFTVEEKDEGAEDKRFRFDADFYQRLHEAIRQNYDDLKPFRELHAKLAKIYAGDRYGKGAKEEAKRTLRNKLRQMISIYKRRLAARNPQVMVDTDAESLRLEADDLQAALNNWCENEGFDSALGTCVLDAIMSFGIMKTGVRRGDSGDPVLDEIGKPFAKPVDINHFVVDLEAQSWDAVDFVGDRSQRSLEWIEAKTKELNLSGAALQDVKSSQLQPEKRLSGVSADNSKSLYKYGWVWNIYLPKEKMLLTLAEGVEKPLEERPWRGPKEGPYDILGLHEVSHEVAPSSPAGDLLSPHLLINELHDKLGEQAMRQKTVLAYEPDASEDAERIKDAKDGQAVKVAKGAISQKKIGEFSIGGADAVTSNSVIRAEQNFDTDAGNLLALGGLGAQAETARQDELISSTSSAMLEDMRKSVYAFTKRVLRKVGAYLYIDAAPQIISKELGGVRIEKVFAPGGTEEQFFRLNFQIVPHSMSEDTPDTELQRLLFGIERFMLPLQQSAQAQGIAPNVREIMRRMGKLSRQNFGELLISADASQPLEGQEPFQPGRPAVTHRINERISRPGVTPYGNDQAMMAANAGAKPHGAAQMALAQ